MLLCLLLPFFLALPTLGNSTVSTVTPVPTTPVTPSRIPRTKCEEASGVLSRSEKQCFVNVNESMTFIHAERYCMSHFGGHLASVHNGFDNLLITDFARSDFGKTGNYWIGINDLDKDETFAWLDNTEVEFTRWDSIFRLVKESCTTVDLATAVWSHTSCFAETFFVCSFSVNNNVR